ncbi:hypothetical protein ACFYX5_07900 [Streptomyces rubiginosohelvolus]|uniref:hypothetical protein n=1 Tax=Streptomyces rubiginosohelvolus TaxID=67362 RepID=UPI00368F4868
MPTCLAIGGTIAAGPDNSSPEAWRHRSVTLYEEVVRPVCEQLGLTFLRADRLTEPGLPDELLRMVTEADVVIADLGVPDVELLFRLGVRHGLRRCTVHVTESGAGPAGAPHIEFPAHTADVAEVRRQLTSALAESVRGEAAPVLPHAQAEPGVSFGAAESDEESPGFFDLVVEAEAQMEAITGDMVEAPWDMQSVAVEFQQVLAVIDMLAASSRQLRGPVRRVSASLRTIFRSVAVLEELQVAAAKLKASAL